MTRYEAAFAIADLLGDVPALTGNKAARLRALQGATPKTLSPEELEKLDGDLRELQTELDDGLQRLGVKIATELQPAPKPKPRYLVFTTSEALNGNVINTSALSKIIEQTVVAENKKVPVK